MNPTKVFLVEDKPVYRNAMKALLSKSGSVEIVGEASNGKEFLDQIDKVTPDIVFMDIEMPEMNGIEATKKALLKYPDLVIIGLSLYDNENYVDQLIAAGARGYLLKLSDNSRIFKTILQYPKAEIFFSKEIDPANAKRTSQKKTVLVVDDFEANTYIVGVTLGNAGYAVFKAHSGEEALKIFGANAIDLVITDYKMPKMNGIELTKAIRALPKNYNVPIIFLSAEKGEKEKLQAREAGITVWIQKPFEMKAFLQIVDKAIK